MGSPIDIIFSIGSQLGPGGFASLQSAISMLGTLGGKAMEMIQAADQLSDAMNNNEISINEAAKALKGSASALDLYQVANKATVAGAKLTGEQFSAVARLAKQNADMTGQEFVPTLNVLMEALIRGNERGLKPYGIELESNGTQAEKMAEALRKVVEKAKGVTVELDSPADKLEALSNSLKDVGMQMLANTFAPNKEGEFSIFDWMVEGLQNVRATMAALTPDQVAYQNSLSGFFGTFIFNMRYLFDPGGAMEQWARNCNKWIAEAHAGEAMQPGIPGSEFPEYGPPDKRLIIEEPFVIEGHKPSRGGGGRQAAEEILTYGPNYEDFLAQRSQDEAAAIEARTAARDRENAKINDKLEELDAERLAIQKIQWKEVDRHHTWLQSWQEEYDCNELSIKQMKERNKFAQEFGSVFEQQSQKASAGALAGAWAMDSMRGASEHLVKAVIFGAKDMRKAMLEAVIAKGSAISIEATFESLLCFAMAIKSAAMRQYDAAAEFAVSGAQFAALAVIAGGAAALANRSLGAGSGSRAASGQAGGHTYNYGYNTDRSQGVTVNVVMRDGVEKFLDVVIDENDRRDQNGLRRFKTSD
jgi:hypothetical protein